MSIPRTPTPRYINLDVVLPYLSQQINVDYNPVPIPEAGTILASTFTEQIALSETNVESDLAAFYLTPFVTLDGQDWTNLSDPTYNWLYQLFINRSIYNIYRYYYGITGENKGDDFWTSMLSSYNELLKRVYKLDQTVNYLYQIFPDLKLNPIGMRRILQPSKIGLLGGFGTWNAAYAINATTKNYRGW